MCVSVAGVLITLGSWSLRTMIMALSVLSIPVLLVFLVLVIVRHALRNLDAILASAGE